MSVLAFTAALVAEDGASALMLMFTVAFHGLTPADVSYELTFDRNTKTIRVMASKRPNIVSWN